MTHGKLYSIALLALPVSVAAFFVTPEAKQQETQKQKETQLMEIETPEPQFCGQCSTAECLIYNHNTCI